MPTAHRRRACRKASHLDGRGGTGQGAACDRRLGAVGVLLRPQAGVGRDTSLRDRTPMSGPRKGTSSVSPEPRASRMSANVEPTLNDRAARTMATGSRMGTREHRRAAVNASETSPGSVLVSLNVTSTATGRANSVGRCNCVHAHTHGREGWMRRQTTAANMYLMQECTYAA